MTDGGTDGGAGTRLLIDRSIDWLIDLPNADFKSLCFVIFMLDARRSKYEKGEHPDALDLKARYELALNLNIDLYYIIVSFTRDF